MLKDRQLHDKLGIPIQTLKNWKSSKGYTSLLYKYLIHQNSEKFVKDVDTIVSLYEYDLLTPKEFSNVVEQNWDKFALFNGYNFHTTFSVRKKEEEQAVTLALKESDNSVLLVRYIYAVSKRAELFEDEITRVLERVKNLEVPINSIKFIYVSTSHNPPKYFDKLEQDVRLVNYGSLYEQVSDKHLLIV